MLGRIGMRRRSSDITESQVLRMRHALSEERPLVDYQK
jgi:hypothetical protein